MGQGRQEKDEKRTEMKIAERKAQSKVLFGIKKPSVSYALTICNV